MLVCTTVFVVILVLVVKYYRSKSKYQLIVRRAVFFHAMGENATESIPIGPDIDIEGLTENIFELSRQSGTGPKTLWENIDAFGHAVDFDQLTLVEYFEMFIVQPLKHGS